VNPGTAATWAAERPGIESDGATQDDVWMSYYRQGPFRPSGPGVQFGVPGLTPYVKLLIISCSVVWFVQLLLLRWIDLRLWLGLIPAAVVRGFVWQPATYMFLHAPLDIFHLLFNMLMLWMFGGELERHWGSGPFLRYYLVCGIGAGVLAVPYHFLIGEAAVVTVGASGAVFGLMMAYGLVFSERTVLFMLLFPMKARTMAIILFAVTFFYLVTSRGSGISHIAHLGGAVVGLLYLKRAWRIGELVREIRWKVQRRRFKVMPPRDDGPDRWIH
jgi:membrane associated rhomboid family serine protease